jgi:hypothetical protein
MPMSDALAMRPERGPSSARPRAVLYLAPRRPEHLRDRLDISGLPRVPGLNHKGAEGVRYRDVCLDLLARAGLPSWPPRRVLHSLREVGRLTLDLDRLALAEAAEQCAEARQQILRGLRSEQRRVRGQLLTHTRVVLAIADELRPSAEAHAADALARLTGGA